MEKAIVLEIVGKKAVVLTQKSDFKTVENENYNVGDKITIRGN